MPHDLKLFQYSREDGKNHNTYIMQHSYEKWEYVFIVHLCFRVYLFLKLKCLRNSARIVYDFTTNNTKRSLVCNLRGY